MAIASKTAGKKQATSSETFVTIVTNQPRDEISDDRRIGLPPTRKNRVGGSEEKASEMQEVFLSILSLFLF